MNRKISTFILFKLHCARVDFSTNARPNLNASIWDNLNSLKMIPKCDIKGTNSFKYSRTSLY